MHILVVQAMASDQDFCLWTVGEETTSKLSPVQI